jgi:hypothetical protein
MSAFAARFGRAITSSVIFICLMRSKREMQSSREMKPNNNPDRIRTQKVQIRAPSLKFSVWPSLAVSNSMSHKNSKTENLVFRFISTFWFVSLG